MLLYLLLSVLALCPASVISTAGTWPASQTEAERVKRRAEHTDRIVAHIPLDDKGPIIPTNFVSFSLEPYAVFDWIGRVPHAPSSTPSQLATLLASLHPTPGSPGPLLRIGGNSADMAYYNPTHDRTHKPVMPIGSPLWYDITDNDLLSLSSAAATLNSKLVIGLNFRLGADASLPIAIIHAIERLIGFEVIHAFELGNEPDVFEWTNLRENGYNMSTYIHEWVAAVRDIHEAIPSLPEPIFQGGSFGSLGWLSQWPLFMSKARSYLKSISFHHYPLSLCQGGTPSIHRLLSDYSSQGLARALLRQNMIQSSRDYGLPLTISEGSSVSCGKMPGLSNSFASALWAIDQMFVDASIGITSWHFHYAGGNTTLTYSPLVREDRVSPHLTVMPLFYGLRFFAMATINSSTPHRVQLTQNDNPHIKIYALRSHHGQGDVQIAIIHKDAMTHKNAMVNLTLELPASFSSSSSLPFASVQRLHAPQANSINGVHLNGQTWDRSLDGQMVGTPIHEWAVPVNGSYSIKLHALSAVLLTIRSTGPFAVSDIPESENAIFTSPSSVSSYLSLTGEETHRRASSLDESEETRSQKHTELVYDSIASIDQEDQEQNDRKSLPVLNLSEQQHQQKSEAVLATREKADSTESWNVAHDVTTRSWRARRGRAAVSEARTNYELQIQNEVERTINARKRRPSTSDE